MSNVIPLEKIENKILLIRGQKVILDSDLAKLYEIETRALNQAVKRNMEKFPDDFMFSLKREEIMNLSQFVIGLKIKHSPNVQVFTEQGVAMLSSVLKSRKAIKVNIAIMRTFVNIRKFVSTYEGLARKIAEMENKYDNKVMDIYKVLDSFRKEDKNKKVKEIGFKC
ncbi:ORF6N domain-containing protein [Candidatus Parcubacteria bacterium]|nr:ORF6N domain-containing protein [Candidatus Parcubacteria bacterium]